MFAIGVVVGQLVVLASNKMANACLKGVSNAPPGCTAVTQLLIK
jgi:hypothetical protein